MNLTTALQLGRVSNLPTIWTNTIAGAALAGTATLGLKMVLMLTAFSLFYIGGMFLNDAFDADIDAKERAERPIPAGIVARSEVFIWAAGFLVAGILLLVLVGFGYAFQPGTGPWPAVAGAGLAAAIVYYNANHKNNPVSPLVMGLCRLLVYVAASLCIVSVVPSAVVSAAFVVLCYLIGLTYVAKQENMAQITNLWPLLFLAVPVIWGLIQVFSNGAVFIYWVFFTAWLAFCLWLLWRRNTGDIPRAVISLIAGICLLDAMFMASAGASWMSILALFAFGITLIGQSFISGT